MKKLALSISILALSACNAGMTADQLAIEKAKRTVLASLHDPASARITKVDGVSVRGNVCGGVNAKNRDGNYVGDRPWIAYPDGTAYIAPAAMDEVIKDERTLQRFLSDCRPRDRDDITNDRYASLR